MIVSPDITSAELERVYADDYIRRAVSHDGRQFSAITHNCVEYVAARVGHIFCGAFLLVRFSSIEIEIHSLLFRSALHWSRHLGRAAIDFCFTHHPIQRLTAYVFSDLLMAGNFCLKLGFRYEGTRRDACRRQGVLTGVDIFGITRTDWEARN
jgi:hypothetical protein